jgi:hypothetical protein
MSISSYSSIYALGHKALSDLFFEDVLVEEKVDGSQFSMARVGGELVCRSKGKEIFIDNPEKMFKNAVDVACSLDLEDGWVYRGEYLQSPKHNSLAYNRIPINHIIIFDIDTANQSYLSYEEKQTEAERIGLEVVPLIYSGKINSAEEVFQHLERESILGGQKIEGMVFKNYSRFSADKKTLMGKYVSERFKEVHNKEWGDKKNTGRDFLQLLIEQYKTPARWDKAIQHIRENGQLTNSPKDIGLLLKEVQIDIEKECSEEIAHTLYKHFRQYFMRGVVAGLPEWYKETLLKSQFQPQINRESDR